MDTDPNARAVSYIQYAGSVRAIVQSQDTVSEFEERKDEHASQNLNVAAG